MADKIIYLSLTMNEYQKIEKEAKSVGMTIPTYCKSKIISSEFIENYKLLLWMVEEAPSRKIFSIRQLWEENEKDWEKISRGVKLAIGRQFYSQVSKKNIKNVIEKGYGPNGTMYYIKK
jgi:hypothetical protein